MKQSVRNNIIVMLIIAATVGSLSFFFGGGSNDVLVYNEGRPWNYPKLIAPFDIPIEYDSLSTKRIKDSIESNFSPIFTVNDAVIEKSLENISTALPTISGISSPVKSRLLEATKKFYETGIVDNTTKSLITRGKIKQIRIINRQGNESYAVNAADLKSAMEVYSYLDSTVLFGIDQGKELSQLLYSNLSRSLKYD